MLHLLGLIAALHALLKSSTPQGAVAWTLGLCTYPAFVLPLYLIFGCTHFGGYVEVLRAGALADESQKFGPLFERLAEHEHQPGPDRRATVNVLQRLSRMPFLDSCQAELLIDGQATYGRIRLEIDKAREYVLVLYYKVIDDAAGRAFGEQLMAKAREGIRVYFIYDELGSPGLQRAFVRKLRDAGVKAWPFRTARGFRHSLQFNFRNHRKLVVVDGKVALVGGMNIGDRYLGLSRHFGSWRDTHIVLTGPAVMSVQLVFVEDYHWATGGSLPDVSWVPTACQNGPVTCTYLSSGPADRLNVGVLFYLECILAARSRIWLTSPYFVPDPAILNALKLADLRGVEVRILLPPGHFEPAMRLAALSFLAELRGTGIQLYEYSGYNHSKVMLVDDWLAWVGSSNLDNRSLRLNFEGNLIALGKEFVAQVREMLERDFAEATRLDLEDLARAGLLTLLGSRVARLLAPIL
ncbi:cardiolipin synthase [bacterium]|nr:cardiolipin synthase [bacterium]